MLAFYFSNSRFGSPKPNLRRFAAIFSFEEAERAILRSKIALSTSLSKEFRREAA